VSGMLPVYSVRDAPGLYLTPAGPPPPFLVSADSKGLTYPYKSFRMNTCEHFLEVFILNGLHGQKNRQNAAKHGD